jgi:dTDP-glucose 4,6-dehydratase
MANVLVTGGAEFIGANFVHYWVDKYPDDRVVVLDALTYAGNLASLERVSSNPNFQFVRGNICDEGLVEQLLRNEEIDTVLEHLPAIVDRLREISPFVQEEVGK